MSINSEENDILRLVSSQCHIGTQNLNELMRPYVSHRSKGGVQIINAKDTLAKIKLAARAIVTVENSEDVIVVSARPYGQRAVYKYGQQTGAVAQSSSRWTPGLLTNQMTKKFQEPRLIIVTDPRSDRQAVVEASYVNIPCIALCDTDSLLEFVDIAIPCNNRSTESISMIFWLLAREVKILRGDLAKDQEWDVMVDLFYNRKVELNAEENAEEPVEGEQAEENKEAGDSNWVATA